MKKYGVLFHCQTFCSKTFRWEIFQDNFILCKDMDGDELISTYLKEGRLNVKNAVMGTCFIARQFVFRHFALLIS